MMTATQWCRVSATLGILCFFPATAFADPQTNVLKVDPWGIELTDFCDLRDGAPISEKCEGFVAGVVETTLAEDYINMGRRPDGKGWGPPFNPRRLCLKRIDIKAIIQGIRPYLRTHFACAGFCTSASYVESALYATYPCKSTPGTGK